MTRQLNPTIIYVRTRTTRNTTKHEQVWTYLERTQILSTDTAK